jgi:hypothetical protein
VCCVQSVRELQSSLRDGVLLFQSLVEERERNLQAERRGILATQEALQAAVRRAAEELLAGLDAAYTARDGQLRAQLAALGGLFPLVHAHAMLGSAFAQAAADKCEFLSHVYQLTERLNALTHNCELPDRLEIISNFYY